MVGNKIDLPRREVDSKMAQGYAKSHSMSYMETSAKTRHGVVSACACTSASASVYILLNYSRSHRMKLSIHW